MQLMRMIIQFYIISPIKYMYILVPDQRATPLCQLTIIHTIPRLINKCASVCLPSSFAGQPEVFTSSG